jgi:hypothetical protein
VTGCSRKCLNHGNVGPLINYTLNMVGGTTGGDNYTVRKIQGVGSGTM